MPTRCQARERRRCRLTECDRHIGVTGSEDCREREPQQSRDCSLESLPEWSDWLALAGSALAVVPVIAAAVEPSFAHARRGRHIWASSAV